MYRFCVDWLPARIAVISGPSICHPPAGFFMEISPWCCRRSRMRTNSVRQMLSQESAWVPLLKIALARENHLSETYVKVVVNYSISCERG